MYIELRIVVLIYLNMKNCFDNFLIASYDFIKNLYLYYMANLKEYFILFYLSVLRNNIFKLNQTFLTFRHIISCNMKNIHVFLIVKSIADRPVARIMV